MFSLNVSDDICLIKTGLITQGTFPFEGICILVTMVVDETVQLFISEGNCVVTWKYSNQSAPLSGRSYVLVSGDTGGKVYFYIDVHKCHTDSSWLLHSYGPI